MTRPEGRLLSWAERRLDVDYATPSPGRDPLYGLTEAEVQQNSFPLPE